MSCAVPRTIRYDVGSLPAAWHAVRKKGEHLVFHNSAGGTIAANSSCNVSDADAPLDVLTNHLMFELQDVHEHGRTPFVLAGRAALRTTLDATLDGVPVALDLIVLKKDGCSVDLQLVASPSIVAARRPDFDAFVRGFEPSSALKDGT